MSTDQTDKLRRLELAQWSAVGRLAAQAYGVLSLQTPASLDRSLDRLRAALAEFDTAQKAVIDHLCNPEDTP